MARSPQIDKAPARPEGPRGLAIYAIGDIHGRADLLKQTFSMIDEDIRVTRPEQAIQVFLGDYVDRGPASRATIDLLIDRRKSHEIVLLRGNHEAALSYLLNPGSEMPSLKNFGLLATIRSYGINCSVNPDRDEERKIVGELRHKFPHEHHDFLMALEPSFTCGDYFFVHAGVRPGVALDDQSENDLIWIREDFLEFSGNFGKYIVHGHTPVPEIDIRRNRMNIDTGAYATNKLTTVKFLESTVACATATARTADA
jgi:serine/threonine protein phosphatase 1